MAPATADQANQLMVDRLIAEGALWSPAAHRRLPATPRHAFLDRVFQFNASTSAGTRSLPAIPGPRNCALFYSDRP